MTATKFLLRSINYDISNYHILASILNKFRKKITKLCKQYCNENNVKIVFTSFKISNYFSVKDATPYF